MDNTSMEAGGSQNLEVGLDRDFKLLQSKGGFMNFFTYFGFGIFAYIWIMAVIQTIGLAERFGWL